jgi:hypothetical protein
LTLYAKKDCTDQLRKLNSVSIDPPQVQYIEGMVIVTVTARDKIGRTDSDMGVVAIEGLKGDARANAIMKSITKAKRRVTLSICGLGILDESEVETIPDAKIEHSVPAVKATVAPQRAQKPEPKPASLEWLEPEPEEPSELPEPVWKSKVADYMAGLDGASNPGEAAKVINAVLADKTLPKVEVQRLQAAFNGRLRKMGA